ncbi:hypothetical protein [Nocardia sp. NPDC127526]|uniref:hypothetical protein n=1 Tax=Nocardia sp. NPDC127526 TaxID=3345393 RepID=UPI00362FDFB1
MITTKLTANAVRALVGLTEMRGMQLDVLAEFLGVRRSEVYRLIHRLLDAQALHPLMEVQAGAKWAVPTRTTAAWVLGWRPGDWRPSPMWASHCRAVAQTRVALGAQATERWTSDRIMRHQTPGPGLYPYDGRLIRPDWKSVAVKVDTSRYLTAEQLAHRLRTTVRQAHHDQCAGVMYVCDGYLRPDTVVAVARQALAYGPDLDFRVTDLATLRTEQSERNHAGDTRVASLRHHATGGEH